MSKVSTELSARARNEVSRVLQALASSNQSQVAEQLGIDPSTLSRMKNDRKSNGLTELESCLVLLDILGFKTVLKKYRMISEEKLNALFVMSKAWMESKQTVAGFGSGKTWVGCSSLCDKSWSFPKVPLGYFAPTYPQIRDIFFPTIDEVAFDWGLKTKIYES
uniref:terminase large subunit domain-containing protein n=1 Tax=Acinetobacter nosocomialis TaxID=106654 RepID=UPI0031D7BD12